MKPAHKLVVLHFTGDYADEFDVEFIQWVDRSWWKQYKKDIVEQEDSIFPTDCYFGTNECVSFRSAHDFLDSFDEHLADEEEVKFLQRISGGQDTIGTTFELPEIE